jgi:hypothetical protein
MSQGVFFLKSMGVWAKMKKIGKATNNCPPIPIIIERGRVQAGMRRPAAPGQAIDFQSFFLASLLLQSTQPARQSVALADPTR